MVLECTNISPAVCTFLDLKISIHRGKFLYKSYDKRNDFKFDIVRFPNLKGNIPSAPSYGVYTSQLVRFCDVHMNTKFFITDIKSMTEIFSNQGFSLKKLRDRYLNFCSKYLYRWSKFGNDMSVNDYVHKIFPNMKL